MNPTTPMTSSAGDPRVASRISPISPAGDVEDGRERRHLAQRHEPVLDDPRAAAELGRRDVRVVGALDRCRRRRCATLSPSWTKRRADDRQDAPRRGRTTPWLAAITMPSTTGTIVAVRNGSRVVRRARNPNDSRGLTGVPRSADSASK